MSHEASSILDFIRPRGGLIVVELDRLGRNIGVLFILVHKLEEKEQAFGFWSLPSIPAGRWAAWS
jgi:DNA invertase Pin-like site-specific DNA recombinase